MTCSKSVTSRNILLFSLQWFLFTLRHIFSMSMELSGHRGVSALHWLIRSWEAHFGELEGNLANH